MLPRVATSKGPGRAGRSERSATMRSLSAFGVWMSSPVRDPEDLTVCEKSRCRFRAQHIGSSRKHRMKLHRPFVSSGHRPRMPSGMGFPRWKPRQWRAADLFAWRPRAAAASERESVSRADVEAAMEPAHPLPAGPVVGLWQDIAARLRSAFWMAALSVALHLFALLVRAGQRAVPPASARLLQPEALATCAMHLALLAAVATIVCLHRMVRQLNHGIAAAEAAPAAPPPAAGAESQAAPPSTVPAAEAAEASDRTPSVLPAVSISSMASFLHGLHLRHQQQQHDEPTSRPTHAVLAELSNITLSLQRLGLHLPQVYQVRPGDSLAAGDEAAWSPMTNVAGFVSFLQGLGLQQAQAFGKISGHWVADDTILTLLEFLSSKVARRATWHNEPYDVRVCYVDAHSGNVEIPDWDSTQPPDRNIALLVVHTGSEYQGLHFSSIIINPGLKLVHVFDSLTPWNASYIRRTISQQFPGMKLLEAGFQVKNHTAKVKQSGGTCGPWSLWAIYAYAFNYRGCRGVGDAIRYASLRQADALAFWQTFAV